MPDPNPFTPTAKLTGLAFMISWPRLRFSGIMSLIFTALLSISFVSPLWSLYLRVATVCLTGVLVFGVLERWPRRLPGWCARWVIQVVGVAVWMPLIALISYTALAWSDAKPFWTNSERLNGFMTFSILGLLCAPWFALTTLLRQKEAWLRHQTLAFALERSELERQASEARLHLLQAQVAPHFLFNTLANVQALVDSRSPHASSVLKSLVAYLRAAVPRLNHSCHALGQELQLVRAYLDLMHMRMPDRLQFSVQADIAVDCIGCPPMTLMTLVENAIRHGIDPCEDGGRIDIEVCRIGERCLVRISDTGVGLHEHGNGTGTGLASLRERRHMSFGDQTRMSLVEQKPSGVLAELEFPAEGVSPNEPPPHRASRR